ncbi:MAG: NAD(P)H-dependent oxidoreductase [Bacteroidales bacterium]|jgi:glutathione-regulated potassium-efflux system ancillary protein KefG|nr:NAD(P)H-dependent oxidoreductase [Bacteroidales bacterium]
MKKLFLTLICAIICITCFSQKKDTVHQYTAEAVFIVAHPDLKKSVANAVILERLTHLNNVTKVIDLYNDKKAFDLSYCKEKIGNAGVIVFQFPFYFAQAPSEMKRWIDEVVFQLVADDFFKGRKFMIVTTTGAEQETYTPKGRNLYTVEELLIPYKFMANHLQMEWQTPFVVYNISGANATINAINGLKEFETSLLKIIFSVAPKSEKSIPYRNRR